MPASLRALLAVALFSVHSGCGCGGPDRPPVGPRGPGGTGTIALPDDLLPISAELVLAATEATGGASRAPAFGAVTREESPDTLNLLESGALVAAPDGVVTLHFDRPVVGGAAIGRPFAAGPIRWAHGEITGEYTWTDASTLTFRTEGVVSLVDPEVARLDPALRDLGGAPLGGTGEFEVQFEPLATIAGEPIGWRPVKGSARLIATAPEGDRLWRGDRPLLLLFDQPTDPATVAKKITLSRVEPGGKTSRVAIAGGRAAALPWPGADPRTVVAISTATKLGDGVELSLSLDLPVAPRLDSTLALRTPPPFVVTSVWCPSEWGCASKSATGASWTAASWSGHIVFPLTSRPRTAGLRDAVTVTPAPKAFEVWADEREVHVDLTYGAAKSYVVTLAPTISDENGRRLVAGATVKVDRAEHPPAARLPSGEVVLDRTGPLAGKLPLSTIAVAGKLRVRALEPADLSRAVRAVREWDDTVLAALLATAPTVPIAKGAGDKWETHRIDLAAASGKPGATLFAVAFATDTTAGAPDLSDRALVQVTDLGVTALVLEEGILVWVTRLGSAEPVAGAEVSLVLPGTGAPAPARTGPDGTAFLATRGSDTDGLVVARTEGDLAYTTLSYEGRLDSAGLGLPSADPKPVVMAFSERGIYRPPDLVHLKAIVRLRGGGAFHPPPAGAETTLAIRGPDGETVHEARGAVGAHGSVSFDVPVLAGWKLGPHQFEIEVAGKESSAHGYGSFEVAEFRVPEFEVDVEIEGKPGKPLFPGEKLRAKIAARYLAGGPVGGATVAWTVRRRSTELTLPGWKGFTLPRDYGDEVVASGTGRLAADGTFALSLVPRVDDAAGPVELVLEAQVTDAAFQTVAARTTALAHARTEYALVRALPMKKGKGAFEVVVVTPDGKPIAGRAVSFAVLERYEYGWWEGDGEDEEFAEGSSSEEWEVKRCPLVSKATVVRCSFEAWEWGSYVGRARLVDTLGRIVATEAHTAGGEPEGDEAHATTVKVPAGEHAPGTVVDVEVHSPFPAARAVLAVVRESVLHEEVVTLRAGVNRLALKVESRYGPDAFVVVHLVSPRRASKLDAAGRDTGRPAYRAGAATLFVKVADAGPLRANVTSDADRYRPGDTAKIRVEVKTSAGSAAAGTEVALWAVDEGILMLTHYRTPDGAKAFDPHTFPWVTIHDNRFALPIDFPLLMDKSATGGGGEYEDEGASPNVRKDFARTILWLPHLVADASGVVTAEVKLPDNLTAFRLMAVAVDERGRGASAEKRIESSLPLQIVAALPRFATLGDRFEARAVVRNRTGAPLAVKVHFGTGGAGGLTLDRAGAVGETSVEVPAGLTAAVSFPVVADRLGRVEVAFRATAGTLGDEMRTPLEIVPPTIELSGSVAGAARDHVTVAVDLPGDALAGRGAIELVAARSPANGLGSSLEELVQYPHGCVEQMTSSTYPLIALRDILPSIGYTRHPRAELDALARAGLDRLAKMRTDAGGLAYWPGEAEPHPYGTAYAMLALSEAHRAGLPMAPGLLVGAGGYLRKLLDEGSGTARDGAGTAAAAAPASGLELGSPHASEGGPLGGLAGRAYVVMVLVTAGEKLPSHLEALYLKRSRLDPFGLAALGIALARSDRDDPRARDVLDLLERAFDAEGKLRAGPAPKPGYHDDHGFGEEFGSPARTIAFALTAVSEIDVTSPLAAVLVKNLLADSAAGRWSSTQETSFTLMALATFFRRTAGPSGEPFVLRIGGKEIAPVEELGNGARRWVVDPASLSAAAGGGSISPSFSRPDPESSLTRPHLTRTPLELTGAGVFYVSANLRYARPLDPAAGARAAGIAVARRIEHMDGTATGTDTPIAAGTMVRVRVLVELDADFKYVAIETPLPAGLEAIDPRLATSGGGGATSTGTPEAIAGRRILSHVEMHDDRVAFFANKAPRGRYELTFLARATTAGSFVAAPVHAYMMYDGDTWGLGSADRIKVAAR